MTAPPPALCPTCSGLQMLNHPAGVLAWQHSNDCTLRAAEDSTQVADRDRFRVLGRFVRPATPTEVTLLAVVDGAPATRAVDVLVTQLSPGVRRRNFSTPRA